MCLWLLGKRRFHPCILVGPVVYGKPVAPYNRTVLYVPRKSYSVEDGSTGAVKAGRGKIRDVIYLGRVTVPLEEHLHIVQHWIEAALKDMSIGGLSEEVISGIQERIADYSITPSEKTVQLDVFRAVIVNRMEDKVFVHRTPTS